MYFCDSSTFPCSNCPVRQIKLVIIIVTWVFKNSRNVVFRLCVEGICNIIKLFDFTHEMRTSLDHQNHLSINQPYRSGMREVFLMVQVRCELVPIQVGLKNKHPSLSRRTSGQSADAHSCTVCGVHNIFLITSCYTLHMACHITHCFISVCVYI